MLLLGAVFNMKHFSALFFVVLSIVVGILLLVKYTDYKSPLLSRRVIMISAITFIFLEVLKLTLMVLDGGGFPMHQIPFHLCSFPLYGVAIVAFSKPDSKIHKFLLPAIYSTVMLGGIITLLYPVNVIGNDVWFPWENNLIPLISFSYHGLMIFLPVFLLVSGYYRPRLSDTWKAICATLVLMVVAVTANIILDQDYMLLNEGKGSPFAFLRDIHQLVYTFGMIFIGLFAISLSFFIGFLVNRKV